MSTRDDELIQRLQEIGEKLLETHRALQSLIGEVTKGRKIPSDTIALEGRIKKALGDHLQHVDVVQSQGEIRIHLKRFLERDEFRVIADVIRRYGGRWDGSQRSFMVPLRRRSNQPRIE